MKLTTAAQVLAIGLFSSLMLTSCKGNGLEPEEYGKPVKMVHTYVITAEEPVNIIWNVMGMGEDIYLNGENVGDDLSPLSLTGSKDRPFIEGTQTFSMECTTSQFLSSFQIDWDESKGKKLSYKVTLTKKGKVVYTGEESFPNEDQPDTESLSFPLGYITTTWKGDSDGVRK